jgi:hypothetical protein
MHEEEIIFKEVAVSVRVKWQNELSHVYCSDNCPSHVLTS